MISIWQRIESFLENTSSELIESLAGPSENLSIENIFNEKSIIPTDFLESLGIHDGQSYNYHALVYPWRLLPEREIIENISRLEADFLDDSLDGFEARGSVKPMNWNTLWIPFAADDSGNYLCVDYDPEPEGNLEQVILWASDPPYVEVISPSYRAWLEHFAADLESGKFKWDAENNEWSRVKE